MDILEGWSFKSERTGSSWEPNIAVLSLHYLLHQNENWSVTEMKGKAVDCSCLDKKLLIFLSDLDVYILLKAKWECVILLKLLMMYLLCFPVFYTRRFLCFLLKFSIWYTKQKDPKWERAKCCSATILKLFVILNIQQHVLTSVTGYFARLTKTDVEKGKLVTI